MELLSNISNFLWGIPLILFLLICNLILMGYSRFLPIKGFIHALKLLISHNTKQSSELGQLTHFQALCNALAATVGIGNISGVALALYQGGAGAIFWMWVAALFGMNAKFFECTLAVMYRDKDYQGEIQGGPMYYIEKGMNKKWHFTAKIFGVAGLIGTLSLFQVNQIVEFCNVQFNFDKMIVGTLIAGSIAIILLGGIKRISKATSAIVPFMSLTYILIGAYIIASNISEIPEIFSNILSSAFNLNSVAGGGAGYGLMHIIQTGVRRAAFSNEAGVGTAAMAHGNAKTNEPISEGYVAMLGPFLDTIVICTITALIILIGAKDLSMNLNGINLTAYAFNETIGKNGIYYLALIVFLFGFSTVLGMANYCKKCWDYLFKGKYGMKDNAFIIFYCTSILCAAMIPMKGVVEIIDISFALMVFPNVFALIYLGKKVVKELKIYNKKYDI